MNKLGKSCLVQLKNRLVMADGSSRLFLWETMLRRMTLVGERSFYRRVTSPLADFLRGFYHDQSPK